MDDNHRHQDGATTEQNHPSAKPRTRAAAEQQRYQALIASVLFDVDSRGLGLPMAILVKDGKDLAIVRFGYSTPESQHAAFAALSAVIPVLGADEVVVCLDATIQEPNASLLQEKNVLLISRFRRGELMVCPTPYGIDDQGRRYLPRGGVVAVKYPDPSQWPSWAWAISNALAHEAGTPLDIHDTDAIQAAISSAIAATGLEDPQFFAIAVVD
jgi:hypothetical protein